MRLATDEEVKEGGESAESALTCPHEQWRLEFVGGGAVHGLEGNRHWRGISEVMNGQRAVCTYDALARLPIATRRPVSCVVEYHGWQATHQEHGVHAEDAEAEAGWMVSIRDEREGRTRTEGRTWWRQGEWLQLRRGCDGAET